MQDRDEDGRYQMLIERNVPIPMRDGATLFANVYRPNSIECFPVLMTLGPYGKDVHLSEFMPDAWEALKSRHPEILAESTCKHLAFERPDPEIWVERGYVVIAVDSRGAGKSPGFLDPNSPAEFQDFYDAIEWAAGERWSTGKVGLIGVSYYAAGQWMVAGMQPPHLAAILPWQGASDFYRDRTRQGGILGSGFVGRWWPRSVLRNQYGNPESPFHDIETGDRNTGPDSLGASELEANRVDYVGNLQAHPLDDDWYRERSPALERIDVPALVVANWGGLGLHLRGTIEGYLGIASQQKWLKVQSGSYFLTFLLPESVALQRRFFDYTLKGIQNGWSDEPKVEVQIRALEDTVKRTLIGRQWPLEGIHWTRRYLDAHDKTLATLVPSRVSSTSYAALGHGVSFRTAPFEREVELCGPVRARLYVSSDKTDMDVFATLRAYDKNGREATFFSATEPHAPISQGWLRVSQRRIDPTRSTDSRPYHAHTDRQLLRPGEVVAIDLEIWPMSVAMPPGSVLELLIQGKDFERPGATEPTRGSGFFTHADPGDRPPAIFGGVNTIHTGPTRESYLLLPVLPPIPG